MLALKRSLLKAKLWQSSVEMLSARVWCSKTTTDDFQEEVVTHDMFTGDPFQIEVGDLMKEDMYLEEEVETKGRREYRLQMAQSSVEKEDVIRNIQPPLLETREARSDHYFPKMKKPARGGVLDQLKVATVMRAYMLRGHLSALIDPLYITRKKIFRPEFPSRTVLRQHRVPVDRDTLYLLPNNSRIGDGTARLKLGELIRRLNAAYSDTIGSEFYHVPINERRQWIRDRMETIQLRFINNEDMVLSLKALVKITAFAKYLNEKLPSDIRYSLTGSEASVCAIQFLVERAVNKYGASTFVLGMRRLGRFGIMAHILGVPLSKIFSMLNSVAKKSRGKYTLGTFSETQSQVTGRKYRLCMIGSPSVPSIFYPIVVGKARGLQDRTLDKTGNNVWPIIIHFIRGLNSQGIIYETLKLTQNPDYSCNGTIHIAINNQFARYRLAEKWTAPELADGMQVPNERFDAGCRWNNFQIPVGYLFLGNTQMEYTMDRGTHMTSEYCTDVLKSINAPIFHVNGDDIRALSFVMNMAADYRAKFKSDIAIDIVCYSRQMESHTATQYSNIQLQEAIKLTTPVVEMYTKELVSHGIILEKNVIEWKEEAEKKLAEAWHESLEEKKPFNLRDWTSHMHIDEIVKKEELYPTYSPITGVKMKLLSKICSKMIQQPPNFKITPKQLALLKKRNNLVEKDTLDWVLCEGLAYGTILYNGKNVRISGMDINRRYHILKEDKMGGQEFNLLNHIHWAQAHYTLCNSTSSQYASLGFEYGYSLAQSNTLVVWEAPNGDKTSKAQAVIDHYIAGGLPKFDLHSNIILLVPHYHRCHNSSLVCNGRPERFLQLVNNCETLLSLDMDKQMKEANMILANVSNPANFFHIVRRQILLPINRPLVIFIPNWLASHPECKAKLSELAEDTKFKMYIPDDTIKSPLLVKKVIFCTGKVYYDLKEERKTKDLEQKIAICRIEQISPLPYQEIVNDLKRYINVKNFCWAQEEPMNQGWWSYMEPRLLNMSGIHSISYAGRSPKADGGSRSEASCLQEQQSLLQAAIAI